MATAKKTTTAGNVYGTAEIINTTGNTLVVYVVDPAGVEHLITRLEPGQKTVQFTPSGVTWKLRPEAAEMSFVAQPGHNVFETSVVLAPAPSGRKGRGGTSITTGGGSGSGS